MWYAPSPCEFSGRRLTLDFGLRSADLFFRELVVPGLGRIWFARQLSWPLAALALYEELTRDGWNVPKPTAICHGIEALACKLEYEANTDRETRSRRILGTREFGRDKEQKLWSFHELRQASNYVRNTHRQAATRAIRVDGGIGFARGSRFDLLELDSVGHQLADVFLKQRVGQGRTTLKKWIKDWLQGEKTLPASRASFRKALSPEHTTDDERALVRSWLLGTSTAASEKRQRLADSVGRAEALRDIEQDVTVRLRYAGHDHQADETLAARAFGAVLDRARDVVAALTMDRLGIGRRPEKLPVLAADQTLKTSLEKLRVASTNYLAKANTAGVNEPTSRAFADAVAAADDAETIRLVVQRAGEVLGLDDDSVVRGVRFRVIDSADDASDREDGAASIEPDRTGRTFRIANLHALLREVDPRGRQ